MNELTKGIKTVFLGESQRLTPQEEKLNKLMHENFDLRNDLQYFYSEMRTLYRCILSNNYQIPIILDEPTIKMYTNENIASDFTRVINIPIDEKLVYKLQETLNKYEKYKENENA